jgi:hypothetical protein
MLDRIAALIRCGQKIIFAEITDGCQPPKSVGATVCFDHRATASLLNRRATIQLTSAPVGVVQS